MKYKASKHPKDKDRNFEVDLALAVMCAIQIPGERVRYDTIAYVTGLSTEGPKSIEQRALLKLRKTLGDRLYRELSLYL